jgi:hypothetical protein
MDGPPPAGSRQGWTVVVLMRGCGASAGRARANVLVGRDGQTTLQMSGARHHVPDPRIHRMVDQDPTRGQDLPSIPVEILGDSQALPGH